MSNLNLEFCKVSDVKTMPIACIVMRELATAFGTPAYAVGTSINGKELSDLYICGYNGVKYSDLEPIFDLIETLTVKTSKPLSDFLTIHLCDKPYWVVDYDNDTNLSCLFVPDNTNRVTCTPEELENSEKHLREILEHVSIEAQLVNLYSLLFLKLASKVSVCRYYYVSPNRVLCMLPETYRGAFQVLRTMFYVTISGEPRELLGMDLTDYKEELDYLASLVDVELRWN